MPDLLAPFPVLKAACDESRRILADLTQSLLACRDVPGLLSVAVAGSLGRLEQTAHSDVDLIIVVDERKPRNVDAAPHVWKQIARSGHDPPKPGGIFSRPLTRAELVDPSTLGIIDEDVAAFGVRMQLLLEGRLLFGKDAFRSLVRDILLRFFQPDDPPQYRWSALLDDLLRYHRSLCARYRFIARNEPARALELQLKAAYSRLLNVSGTLFLLAESLNSSDPVCVLLECTEWSPLQRIARVGAKYDRTVSDAILSQYQEFLAAMQDDGFRRAMSRGDRNARYTALMQSGGLMKQQLVGFVLARSESNHWPRSFLEQLIL